MADDAGFYKGVAAALCVVRTMEGDDSTLFREIVRSCNPQELVSHADIADLKMFAASPLTKPFVAARRRALRRSANKGTPPVPTHAHVCIGGK